MNFDTEWSKVLIESSTSRALRSAAVLRTSSNSESESYRDGLFEKNAHIISDRGAGFWLRQAHPAPLRGVRLSRRYEATLEVGSDFGGTRALWLSRHRAWGSLINSDSIRWYRDARVRLERTLGSWKRDPCASREREREREYSLCEILCATL